MALPGKEHGALTLRILRRGHGVQYCRDGGGSLKSCGEALGGRWSGFYDIALVPTPLARRSGRRHWYPRCVRGETAERAVLSACFYAEVEGPSVQQHALCPSAQLVNICTNA